MVKKYAKNTNTVLSQARDHRRSQLKRQKLKWGGCMEEVLKWFNYPTFLYMVMSIYGSTASTVS